MVEQEASVLKTKVLTLEEENEKIANENKKLALHAARLSRKDSLGLDKDKSLELAKVKDSLSKLEKTREELENKLKTILDIPVDKPARMPKSYSENSTKFQLQVRFVRIAYYFTCKSIYHFNRKSLVSKRMKLRK